MNISRSIFVNKINNKIYQKFYKNKYSLKFYTNHYIQDINLYILKSC